MKNFLYNNLKYRIDSSRIISNGGDIDENKHIIFIDKDIPKKFHEGIATHEIEERKLLKIGHSYVFAHNEAQKKELKFYQKQYGKKEGARVLEDEENIVLIITYHRSLPAKNNKKLSLKKGGHSATIKNPPITIKNKNVVFGKKCYAINTSRLLIGTLVDVCEKNKTVYIDKNIPKKFREGLILYELTVRKILNKDLSWRESNTKASKIEEEYLTSKLGSKKAQKLMDDELKLQAKKFSDENKKLKMGGREHKIIYEKDEILPQ